MKHAEYRDKVIKTQIELMHERGIWKRPQPQRMTSNNGDRRA
jgi:hypothetical protein